MSYGKILSRRSTELLEHDLADRFFGYHRLENNPGCAKALEAAAAVNGLAIFPEFSPELREQGLADFKKEKKGTGQKRKNGQAEPQKRGIGQISGEGEQAVTRSLHR
jgi:phage/plasmid primase-like uncharacterized protein